MKSPGLTALSVYRATASAVEPAAVAWLRLRAWRRDARERERLGERFQARPDGSLLWLHGVSVGESLSLLPLVEALACLRPNLQLLVSSRTRTSAALLEQRLPKGVLRSYAPLDLPNCVGRFLQAWRPGALVLAESELWPGLMTACHAAGVPVALINARLSERSIRNWYRFPASARVLFGPVALAEAQDPATAERLTKLGASPSAVGVAGSFKAAGGPLPGDPEQVSLARTELAGRLAWLAASTHQADEDVVLGAHARILQECPGARLVIVPRHPSRGGGLARAAESRGWRFARRSAGDSVAEGEAVYIADTLGELGLWYRALPVAFIGGSFGGVGGHNPFEPAALGAAILHGPDVTNFRGIYNALDRGFGARRVADAAGLSAAVLQLLDAEGRPACAAGRMAERAAEIAAPAAGEAERLAKRILGMMDRKEHGRGGVG